MARSPFSTTVPGFSGSSQCSPERQLGQAVLGHLDHPAGRPWLSWRARPTRAPTDQRSPKVNSTHPRTPGLPASLPAICLVLHENGGRERRQRVVDDRRHLAQRILPWDAPSRFTYENNAPFRSSTPRIARRDASGVLAASALEAEFENDGAAFEGLADAVGIATKHEAG